MLTRYQVLGYASLSQRAEQQDSGTVVLCG